MTGRASARQPPVQPSRPAVDPSPAGQGATPTQKSWDGLIVLCAANNYDGIKMADRHMAEQLARLLPVLYVDPPMSVLTVHRHPELAASLDGPRLREVGPGLARLTPVVAPFPTRRGMTALTNHLARRIVARAVSQLGVDAPLAVVSAWPLHPMLGGCGERVRIYWVQDDYAAGGSLLGIDAGRLLAGERRSAAPADAIVVVTPELAARWQGRGYVTHLIPNGADPETFASVDESSPPADVGLPPPIAGFVGHINDRIDLALLEAVAERGRSLLLVGPRSPTHGSGTAGDVGGRWSALIERPNVAWVGPKPFDALPSYLGAMDVGLVPYGDSPFNRSSFPMKTLEYLAAGRPVVATDLPATRWLATDLIAVAGDPGGFADATDRWLLQPRTPAAMQARRAFAARHSWASRARALVDVITGAEPDGPRW